MTMQTELRDYQKQAMADALATDRAVVVVAAKAQPISDTEMLNWLLGRLHIVRQTPNQDIWQTVSFAAPQWDCAEKGQHDMRAIVAQAMTK